MTPQVKAALVSGAFTTGAGLAQFIGQGIQGAEQAQIEQEKEKRRQFEWGKEFDVRRRSEERQAGFQGLDALMNIQNQAMANTRGNQLRSLIVGGK